jgi:hypothetical protein
VSRSRRRRPPPHVAPKQPTLRAPKLSTTATPPPPPPPPPPPKSPIASPSSLWKAIKWALGTLVALVSLVAALDQIWGPMWPTSPDVEPGSYDEAQPLVLSFTARNRSVLFPINAFHVACIYGAFYTENRNFGAWSSTIGTSSNDIAAESSIPIKCSSPVIFRNQKLTNAILWVRVTYTRPYSASAIPRVFGPFFYDATVTPPKWVIGIPAL